jgi:hypothetical protein
MTAYDAAKWYMLGVAWSFLAGLLTLVSPRPGIRWLELAAAYAVVLPLLGAWRRAA